MKCVIGTEVLSVAPPKPTTSLDLQKYDEARPHSPSPLRVPNPHSDQFLPPLTPHCNPFVLDRLLAVALKDIEVTPTQSEPFGLDGGQTLVCGSFDSPLISQQFAATIS